MKNIDTHQQTIITTSAVLTGLTPLIPIPFVDDLIYTQFMRQMCARLAATHEKKIPPDDIKVLSDARGGSCLPGCLGTLIIYPFKKILRKILFFLEWKRAADIVCHTYYHGYLLNYGLRENYLAKRRPEEVRAAIDKVLLQLDTRPLERTVRHIIRQSKTTMRGAVDLLSKSLAGKKRQDEVAQALEEVEEAEEQQVAGVVQKLQTAFAALPAEHFQKLEIDLGTELK